MDHHTSRRGTHQENGTASLSCHRLEWNLKVRAHELIFELLHCAVDRLHMDTNGAPGQEEGISKV